MNFRRLPFQFTAVNPSERQAEIRKRFGLPNDPSNMILDLGNSSNMSAGFKEINSTTSSPRLQHRVPVFVEDPDPRISEKSRSNNVDNGKKPTVRVIPIEYEGDRKPVRQRNLSGPAGIQQNGCVQDIIVENGIKPVKHATSNSTLPNRKRMPSGETGPHVHNIPIQIEKSESSNEPLKKPNLNSSPKDSKMNGCKVTKASSDDKLQKSEEQIPEAGFKPQLQKVDDILNDLKPYASEVESFSGTATDKQYRYLDEMLTRIMLRLDGIETMGDSEVRNTRKAAIKKVQSYIDLLETKINSDSKVKGAKSTISVDSKDFSDDIKEDKLHTEKDVIECSTQLQEVPEVQMAEATVTEAQELIESNKTNLDEVEMVKACTTDSEKKDNCDENLEIPYSTDRNASDSQPEIKMASRSNFELSELQDRGSQVINTTTELQESSSLETSSDIDMVESPEKSRVPKIENSVQNFDGNCDIEMSDCSIQSIENSKTKLDCNLIIPEDVTHNDIKESPKEILGDVSIVTTSNQNAELLRSNLEEGESKLTDYVGENKA